MSRLTITENDRSVVHEILEEEILLGRREGATIRLKDPDAGEEHCQIRAVPGLGYKLIDLESRAGTKVNGAYVNQQLLKDGDVIEIGGARIAFALEGAGPPSVQPPPLPATAAAAAPAAQAAVASRPSRAPARPPARAVVRQPDRDARTPRRGRKKESSAPIIALGVLVGMMLFAVAALQFAGGIFDPGTNKLLYREIVDLVKESRYQEAVDKAALANPDEDQHFYNLILVERDNALERIEGRAGVGDHDVAYKAFIRIESWIQDNRHDISGQVDKWEDFVRAHDGTSWARQARHRLSLLLGGAPPSPGGGGKIDRKFRVALATANALANSDQFQNAITSLWNWWDENDGLTQNLNEWQRRVKDAADEIENRAEKRFRALDEMARDAIDRGEYESAIKIYRNIAEKFGMEKYQQRANAALRKLHKDD